MKSYLKLLPILIIALFAACEEAADLENTFFPAGEGYKWVYETRQLLKESGVLTGEAYDTLTIRVDSTRDALGGKVITFDNTFADVSRQMRVIEDEVSVFHNNKPYWIPLLPAKDFVKSDSTNKNNYYMIYMSHDTLVFFSFRDVMVVSDATITKRIKGVGVVEQSWGGSAVLVGTKVEFRLLYFIKDEDTVWKCSECP